MGWVDGNRPVNLRQEINTPLVEASILGGIKCGVSSSGWSMQASMPMLLVIDSIRPTGIQKVLLQLSSASTMIAGMDEEYIPTYVFNFYLHL